MSALRPLNAILAVNLHYYNGSEFVPEHRARMPRLTQVRRFSELLPFTSRLEIYSVLFEDFAQDKKYPALVEKEIAQVLTQCNDTERYWERATPVELAAALRGGTAHYSPAIALDTDVYQAVVGGFAAHVEQYRQAGFAVNTLAQKRIVVSPQSRTVRVEGLNKTVADFSLADVVLDTLPTQPVDEQVF